MHRSRKASSARRASSIFDNEESAIKKEYSIERLINRRVNRPVDFLHLSTLLTSFPIVSQLIVIRSADFVFSKDIQNLAVGDKYFDQIADNCFFLLFSLFFDL